MKVSFPILLPFSGEFLMKSSLTSTRFQPYETVTGMFLLRFGSANPG